MVLIDIDALIYILIGSLYALLQMQTATLSSLEFTFLETLRKQGYVVRPRGRYSLEVWGTNLTDHFVFTYDLNQRDLVDIVFFDPRYVVYHS